MPPSAPPDDRGRGPSEITAPKADVPAISVIVPTFRRPELLAACLSALGAQTVAAEAFEVVVVDDGSGDATPRVLERVAATMPGLRSITHPVNRGPAAARNRAVAEARGDLLLFLDDDIAATPTLVSEHLALHGVGPSGQGYVAGQGYVGRVEWLPSLTVTPFMRWLDATPLQFRYECGLEPGPVGAPEQAFYTCNLSMCRSDFVAAGGFDERFPYPAYEDIELGFRLGRSGFRLSYAPQALAYHARAITLDVFAGRMEKVGESAVLAAASHPELPLTTELDDPPGAAASAAIRVLAAMRPSLFGRDVRSRHFWNTVERAYARGVRRGRALTL